VRFQINIYRPGRKPKRVPKPTGEERRISVAMLIVLMVILLGVIYLGYMNWVFPSIDRKRKWNRNQTVVLSSQLSEVERDLEKYSNEAKLLSKLHVKRVLWSGKLVDLSSIIPDDLWLTGLSIKTTEKRKKASKQVEKETYLTIKGVTLPMPGREPLESIAQLILELNGSKSFNQDFEVVKLVYTHLSKEKDREIMEFELSSKLSDGSPLRKEKASR
jgi:Tfp pilus assembly protein PilN